MKITTTHVFPPIPDRQYDWRAYTEGGEEDGFFAYGATEQEAIANLKEELADKAYMLGRHSRRWGYKYPNPFDPGTPEWNDFEEGYQAAKDDENFSL